MATARSRILRFVSRHILALLVVTLVPTYAYAPPVYAGDCDANVLDASHQQLQTLGAGVSQAADKANEQDDSGWSWGRFAWGLVKGAATGLVVGAAAALVVATAPAWVVGTLAVAAVGAAAYGAYSIYNNWDNMTGGDKSELAGNILGGFIGGGIGARAVNGLLASSGRAAATGAASTADDAVNLTDDALNVTDDALNTADDALNTADDALNLTDDALNRADDLIGTSPRAGDFTGLRGATPEEVLSRIPRNATRETWRPIEGGARTGIKYKWTDADGTTWRVRMHGPDPSAPAGSNAASGWIVRIQRGSKFMDETGTFHPRGVLQNPRSPNYNPDLGNRTHIPLEGNPALHP